LARTTGVLEISNLYAGYGQGDVLQDLSFHVDEGEAVCLLGRNGAGKSTTFKAIMQLIQPRQGSIRFRNKDLIGKATHDVALSGVAYVPEDRRIFPGLTVEENLRVPRNGGRDSMWPLHRIYDQFPVLRERQHQLGRTLSGGEQQMLAIARALVGDPSVLLLDEPSEGLAPQMVRSLIDQIARLKAHKLTILLSEQNISVAAGLCERVCIIDRGAVRFAGRLQDLKANMELQRRYLSIGAI
jgi:branched-chain amino acid transport system ATP-binding protein